jgi:hypothetical protein
MYISPLLFSGGRGSDVWSRLFSLKCLFIFQLRDQSNTDW